MYYRQLFVILFISLVLLALPFFLLDSPDAGEAQAQEPTPTSTMSLAPDLSISKSKYSGNALPGNNIQYRINCSNWPQGMAAPDVHITDKLPDFTTYVSDTNAAGFTTVMTGDTVVWTKPSVSGGESDELYLTVHISDTASLGDLLINTVSISTSSWEQDYRYGNNKYTYRLSLGPDLYIDKGKTSGDVEPGEVITYGIYYQNMGGEAAHDVRITDTLPAKVTYVSEYNGWSAHFTTVITAGGEVVWSAPSVPAGENGGFFLTVRISDTAFFGGSLINRVYIFSSDEESDYSDNSDIDIQTLPGGLYLPLILKE